jgi:adenosylcobinamide amidohydrolase
LRAKLEKAGMTDALAFMTSRDITRHHSRRAKVEAVEAACLTTVGLSNAERVGARKTIPAKTGTINTLVWVSRPLTDGAFVEALSIAVEARTAAILETRPAGARPDTGTGTDCMIVAAPLTGEPLHWAGLHTAAGEAVGKTVYDATREGAEFWGAEFGCRA